SAAQAAAPALPDHPAGRGPPAAGRRPQGELTMSRMESFGIAAQEDWGDPEDAMEFFIPVETVDVNHNNEVIEVEETTGTRFPTRIERGTRFAEIVVSGPARIESLGRILYACLGKPTTNNTDAPAFEHTFDPAA